VGEKKGWSEEKERGQGTKKKKERFRASVCVSAFSGKQRDISAYTQCSLVSPSGFSYKRFHFPVDDAQGGWRRGEKVSFMSPQARAPLFITKTGRRSR